MEEVPRLLLPGVNDIPVVRLNKEREVGVHPRVTKKANLKAAGQHPKKNEHFGASLRKYHVRG